MLARRRFLTAVILSLPLGLPLSVWAQTSPAQTGTRPAGPPRLQDLLSRLRYDARERGPLVCVVRPFPFQRGPAINRTLPGPTEPGPTPLALAEAMDCRLFTAGAITVIAPRQMTVINAHPGKPDPYGNLRPEDRLKALMGTLSEAQWQRVGTTGIGLSDLTREQARLMEGTFPKISQVQPMKMVVNPETPNQSHYENDGLSVPMDPRQMRLRLSRTPSYTWQRPGQDGYYGSGTYRPPAAGTRLWMPAYRQADEEDTKKQAYGVTLIAVVPSRLKQGELDFASPVLNAPVALEPDESAGEKPLKTVGDLLKQIGTATGLELRADARLVGLPVWVRSVPGQTVRAGDLLMALAFSVTGAYRRLEPRLFVLSDDVEGLGTRFARLQAWADEANNARQEMLSKALDQAAKRDPLRYLGFAPGQVALPADLVTQIEKRWRHYSEPTVSVSALPADVQKDVEQQRQVWEHMTEPVYLDKDKVQITLELKAQWVLPNGGTLEDYDRLNIMGGNSLSRLLPQDKAADAPPAPVPPATPAKPNPLKSPFAPATPLRRVIVLSPDSPEQARQLMQAAQARGFNEFWIYQTLADKDNAPLRAAIAWGKKQHAKVWAATSLVRNASIGAPERTILGQTGQEWADAYVNQATFTTEHPDWRYDAEWQSARYVGWSTPSSEQEEVSLQTRLLTLARTPGLAGLCLKDVLAPGASGESSGGDGLMTGGGMGYTVATRAAMLRQNGYDPVDIIPDLWSLDVDKSLPFFPYEQGQRYKEVNGQYVPDTAFVPPPTLWKRFQNEQVRSRMTRLYPKLRTAVPTLPLYLDDGISAFASAETSWFGSWDVPDRLPKNPVYRGNSEGDQAAQAASNTRLVRCAWDRVSGKTQEEEWFNSSVTRTAARAEKKNTSWHGVAVDLSNLNAKDALHMLNALPVLPPDKP